MRFPNIAQISPISINLHQSPPISPRSPTSAPLSPASSVTFSDFWPPPSAPLHADGRLHLPRGRHHSTWCDRPRLRQLRRLPHLFHLCLRHGASPRLTRAALATAPMHPFHCCHMHPLRPVSRVHRVRVSVGVVACRCSSGLHMVCSFCQSSSHTSHRLAAEAHTTLGTPHGAVTPRPPRRWRLMQSCEVTTRGRARA